MIRFLFKNDLGNWYEVEGFISKKEYSEVIFDGLYNYNLKLNCLKNRIKDNGLITINNDLKLEGLIELKLTKNYFFNCNLIFFKIRIDSILKSQNILNNTYYDKMIKGLEYLVGKSVYGNTFKYFHRGKVLYLKIEKNGLNINDNVKILFKGNRKIDVMRISPWHHSLNML